MVDGLPVTSARKVIVNQKGTVITATDAGLHYSPAFQPHYETIKNTLGSRQIWDICIFDSLFIAGSYNDGLFVFNHKTGKLLKHFLYSQFPKIRKLRIVNNQLFILCLNGVYQFENNQIKLLLYTKNLHKKDPICLPMDIFFRDNHPHIVTYPEPGIWQQQAPGIWQNIAPQLIKNLVIAPGNKKFASFPNLSAFEFKGDIYLGGQNEYAVWNANNTIYHYAIDFKNDEGFAIWDWASVQGQVYASCGNTESFESGGLIQHHKNQFNIPRPSWNQAIWSITNDPSKNILWIATNYGGVFMMKSPNSRINAISPHCKKAWEGDYLFMWDKNIITCINPSNQQIHCSAPVPEDLIKVVYLNNEYYALGVSKLWKISENNTQKFLYPQFKFSPIQDIHNTSKAYVNQGKLWLFTQYGNIAQYNPKTNQITYLKVNPQADCIAQNNDYIIYHAIDKGFFMIQGDSIYPLITTGQAFQRFHADFTLFNDFLLVRLSNSLKLFQIDPAKHQVNFIKDFSLDGLFRNINIIDIHSADDGFIFLLPNIVLKIKVGLVNLNNKNNYQLLISSQKYLGNYSINKFVVFKYNKYVIDHGDNINFIEDEPLYKQPFQIGVRQANEPPKLIQGLLNLNEKSNYQIIILGTDYIQTNRYYYTLKTNFLAGDNFQTSFFIGGKPYWVNGLTRGRYAATIYNDQFSISSLWVSNVDYYTDIPFYLVLLLFIVFSVGVYYNIQQSRESTLRKIAILRLQTLRLNFNPHFIYNSMGLIQSLIVKNETKKAIDVTARLAKLNRTFLTNSTKDLITLEEELLFLKEYTQMEHMRFEDDNDFIFNIHVNPLVHLNTWIIPPLILQPLIENAIKHGILPSRKRGNILIEIEKISNISIGITVSNPITKAKSKVQSTGMGNNLVADRIEIFNNLFGHLTTARFENHTNEEGYYIARITLVKHIQFTPPPASNQKINT